MMSLDANAILAVFTTVMMCTGVVAIVALVLLRLLRRRSLATHIGIVIGAVIVALAASTLAIAIEMYISPHDFSVLIWAVLGAVIAGTLLTAILTRTLRSAFAHLDLSMKRVSAGAAALPAPHGGRELESMSRELAAMSEKLIAARAEIDRIETSRRQFLAGISHDLRTPLTAMRVLAEAGEERLLTDAADISAQVRKQSEAMSRMIDDLFDLSRIDTGTLTLHREPLAIHDLISGVVEDVSHIARTHDVSVLPDGVDDCVITGDPHELSRAITNIVTNAISYGPAGSPVYVSAQCEGEYVTISVRDLGHGVPVSEIVHMFELGWRSDPARAANRTGTSAGLGLAIVQGIAQAHDGEVFAAHEDDGFRVGIRLPLATTARGARAADVAERI